MQPAPTRETTVLTDATPVTLDLSDEVAATVRRWVEQLGWQVVEPGTAALVPPALALTDAGGTASAGTTPTILLIRDADDPAATAARAGQVQPAAVVRWPDDRDRLPDVVADLATSGQPAPGSGCLLVGGSAGGVGTTTVALALAGLSAWRGRTAVLSVLRGDVPVPAVRCLDASDVAGPGVWGGASAVPGVPGLRAVAVEGRGQDVAAGADGVDLLVHDLGVRADADVLVLRRDAAGVSALQRTACAVAVVVDQGPVHPRAIAEAAGGRRLVTVPLSARVARAGTARRVPAGLPGTWLRSLAVVLRDG